LQTVGAVADAIGSLNVGTGDSAVIFEDLKAGLQAPLSGMGTAFSSSLFGLSGSLILGFLDLQAGQAQNKFYTELEDWLATVTDLDPTMVDVNDRAATGDELRIAVERLTQALQDGAGATAPASSQRATAAMANLAEGIQGLVQHMRSEQQVVRGWVEQQADQQRDIQQLLEVIAKALKQPAGE
jgi:hypothetical protein